MPHTISDVTKRSDEPDGGHVFPESGYVRLKQILGPNGPLPISRSGFWAGVKDGKFPKPRKISARVTVWRAEDIRALLAKIELGAL
ncbi:helix-turn-helix transcriptional regulator [Neorhizobium alkalisoli]|uniref:helix-turn-helix transcriptional regulator n=1 Tax=Neorhizobium alkalisoli TaxID=528178 RepID=UPI000CF97317|nr:AlpA family phage regulatory protein [Neorhizobium alkalisoli]